jgi:ribonuclease Z
MKAGTIVLPKDLEGPVDRMLRCWRDVERQGTPYTLVPMVPGQLHEVRRDFAIRAYATHHGGPPGSSLGYGLISVREKLKPEYVGTPGPELAALRKSGVEIQYRLEVPLVVFLGDTTAGPVFEQPDVQNAEVLITECTFFDAEHRPKAKAGKHLHLEQLAEILPKLKNQHLILGHVSRRTGVRRARRLLARRIGEEQMRNIAFLMDFEGAADAGDIEDAGPPLPPEGEANPRG